MDGRHQAREGNDLRKPEQRATSQCQVGVGFVIFSNCGVFGVMGLLRVAHCGGCLAHTQCVDHTVTRLKRRKAKEWARRRSCKAPSRPPKGYRALGLPSSVQHIYLGSSTVALLDYRCDVRLDATGAGGLDGPPSRRHACTKQHAVGGGAYGDFAEAGQRAIFDRFATDL